MPRGSVKMPSKAKYSVLFVGGRETCFPGHGVDTVDAIIRDVVSGQSTSPLPTTALPRFTLSVSRKGLKVIRPAAASMCGDRRRNSRVEKVRHVVRDILLVGQGSDSDTRSAVVCVLYGFNEMTGGWIHACVYWFDEGPEAAERFQRHLLHFVDTPDHRTWVSHLEAEMISKGQILPQLLLAPDSAPAGQVLGRPVNGDVIAASSPAAMTGIVGEPGLNGEAVASTRFGQTVWSAESPGLGVPAWDQSKCGATWIAADSILCQSGVNQLSISDDTNHNHVNNHQSPNFDDQLEPDYDDDDGVDANTNSLRTPTGIVVPTPVASLAGELKSKFGRGAPILLPPKDYDTVNRTRGNLLGIETRRCQNEIIVGKTSSLSGSDDGAGLTGDTETSLQF